MTGDNYDFNIFNNSCISLWIDSFALVIGRLFYKTDVRNYGSGNLGGTNTGRVLGKKAGVLVIILDASKALLVMFLTRYFCSLLSLNEDKITLLWKYGWRV